MLVVKQVLQKSKVATTIVVLQYERNRLGCEDMGSIGEALHWKKKVVKVPATADNMPSLISIGRATLGHLPPFFSW